MTSLESIDSGAELGKYRVIERVTGGERCLFRATTEGVEHPVCLLELRQDEVSALAPTKGVQHAHLAHVHEVLDHDGSLFLVYDAVEGTTLTERLQEIGKKPTVDAVGSALRVSDALSHIHEAGGVHGFLHTDSVVLDPPERLGPILAFAPIPSDERTFHSPERGETGKPSVADDAWAAAGLLYMMLTGEPPRKEGYGSPEELAPTGVEDPELRAALFHGLHRDPSKRSADVRPLKRELARWFMEHSGEEGIAGGGHHSTQPPPLPNAARSKAPMVVAARLPSVRPRRSRVLWFAIGGTLAGLGGAWALSALLGRPKVTFIERPMITPAAVAPVPKPIDLSEVPVTGEEEPPVELDKTASCVAQYLPKGAFAKSPDLAWLCEETDSQKGAQKLRVAIVSGAPRNGRPTDAMKLFARMNWYDLAAHAVVRAGCCSDAKALTLPEPGAGCAAMADALTEVGREVVAGKAYDEPLKRFGDAIQCELNLGRGQIFGRAARPQPGEDTAFRELANAMAH